MTVRVGLIGAGTMGTSHARTIASGVTGARVVAVHDLDPARGAAAAALSAAALFGTADEVIASAEVDAVLVASPDETHGDLALACIAAAKPVLCEKPLATTAAEARAVLDAELAVGHASVQVGFTRRHDPAYAEIHEVVDQGDVGDPRVVHAFQRGPRSPWIASGDVLVRGSLIHEIDVLRWILDDEVVAAEVHVAGRGELADPQVSLLRFSRGAIAAVEVYANAHYGFEVSCEVVGTRGTVTTVAPHATRLRQAGHMRDPVAASYLERFAEAYRNELSAWVSSLASDDFGCGSAWDGFVANLVAEAAIISLESGGVSVSVDVPERPRLYDTSEDETRG